MWKLCRSGIVASNCKAFQKIIKLFQDLWADLSRCLAFLLNEGNILSCGDDLIQKNKKTNPTLEICCPWDHYCTGSGGTYHFYSNHMKFSTKIFLAWRFSYMQWTLTCGIWKYRNRWTLYLWQHKNVSGITILCLNRLGPWNKKMPLSLH